LRALFLAFFVLTGLIIFGGKVGTLGTSTSGNELTIVFARLKTGAKLIAKVAAAIPELMWRCKGSYLYSWGCFTVGGGVSADFFRLCPAVVSWYRYCRWGLGGLICF
jgi:hypothetical protein